LISGRTNDCTPIDTRLIPAATYAAKSAAPTSSGFISMLTSPRTPKRSRKVRTSAATVSGSYVLGVPPPRKIVSAEKSGSRAISAFSARR
jgi:hypothetical protein